MFNTKINLTTPTYGPMTNSIDYVLTNQRFNYGRNSWLREWSPGQSPDI